MRNFPNGLGLAFQNAKRKAFSILISTEVNYSDHLFIIWSMSLLI